MAFHSRVALVAAFFLAFPAAADDLDFRPLKPLLPHGSFTACSMRGVEGFGPSRDFTVEANVDDAGRITSFELPDGSPGWLTDMAGCAVERILFEPELRAGKPAETRVQFQMTVNSVAGRSDGELQVAGVGEFMTPPRMHARSGSSLSGCWPYNVPESQASRLRVRITVAPDGSIVSTEPPAGADPWMERTSKCIAGRLRLYPGTRNGAAVESSAELPLVLNNRSGEFESAKVRADAGMVESAFRACYPPDKQYAGSVVFKFDVNIDGSVNNARILRGSGDAELDKIAACIIPLLKFEPAKINERAVKSNVTWELPVKPPS